LRITVLATSSRTSCASRGRRAKVVKCFSAPPSPPRISTFDTPLTREGRSLESLFARETLGEAAAAAGEV
jgi:hypothetical protein